MFFMKAAESVTIETDLFKDEVFETSEESFQLVLLDQNNALVNNTVNNTVDITIAPDNRCGKWYHMKKKKKKNSRNQSSRLSVVVTICISLAFKRDSTM